jgi:hypothetical protein
MLIKTYPELYDNIAYFTGNKDKDEQRAWEHGMIRYGDQCAAIGYAFGFASFFEIRDLLHFSVTGKSPFPQMTAQQQLELLYSKRRRTPKSVLDVGGGRGEISLAFSHCGIKTQMIEPSTAANELVEETKKKFDMHESFKILNGSLYDQLSHINNDLDTIIFCESIEHIPPDEFGYCYNKIRSNNTAQELMVIIVNWIDFHPIYPSDDQIEHCRMINDEFYDSLTKGHTTIFRLGSHLVFKK